MSLLAAGDRVWIVALGWGINNGPITGCTIYAGTVTDGRDSEPASRSIRLDDTGHSGRWSICSAIHRRLCVNEAEAEREKRIVEMYVQVGQNDYDTAFNGSEWYKVLRFLAQWQHQQKASPA